MKVRDRLDKLEKEVEKLKYNNLKVKCSKPPKKRFMNETTIVREDFGDGRQKVTISQTGNEPIRIYLNDA